MPQLIDFTWLTLIAGFIAGGLGAYIASQTAKRLMPAFRGQQIGNWRRFGLSIAIVIPVLQCFYLSDLHHNKVDLPLVSLFAAILFYVACYQIGSFRWRRQFLGESWSLPSMLFFQLRFFLVFYAPLFALLLIPSTAIETGWPWVAGPMALAVWVCWWLYNPWIAACMGARELRNSQLVDRLNQLAARSTTTPVRWLECGPNGGSFSNAFALAAPAWLRNHAVLITRPMLDQCSNEEIEAVCAHEIAHLEDYDASKQKRIVLHFAIPAMLAGALFPWIMSINTSGRWIGFLAWSFSWMIIARWINRRRLREETGSDRRALELMPDPLHLANALAGLYNRLGAPRRVLAPAELGTTHPSLARRIGLIRRAARLPDPIVPACCARGIGGGQVTITQDGVSIVLPSKAKKKAGLPVSLKWEQIASILIVLQAKQAVLLLQAIDAPQPTRIPIDMQTAAELEPILQTADHRIAALTAIMRHQSKPKKTLLRLMLALSIFPMLLVASANGALAFIILPLLIGCAVRTSRTWLLALGTAMITASGYALLTFNPVNAEASVVGGAALLIPFALSFLLSAFETRRDFVAGFPRGNPWTPLGIGLAAATFTALAAPPIALIGVVAALAPMCIRRRKHPQPRRLNNSTALD